jgi:hypothetical protein
MNKYIDKKELCEKCLEIFKSNNDNIKLSELCLLCKRKYNLNKALAFAERNGGKKYWEKQRIKNKDYRKDYYKKNREKILTYQKNYRNNRKIKQDQP